MVSLCEDCKDKYQDCKGNKDLEKTKCEYFRSNAKYYTFESFDEEDLVKKFKEIDPDIWETYMFTEQEKFRTVYGIRMMKMLR